MTDNDKEAYELVQKALALVDDKAAKYYLQMVDGLLKANKE